MIRTDSHSKLCFMILLSIITCIFLMLTAKRNVKLLDEEEVPTERTTLGLFWKVIENEDFRIRFGKDYHVKLPENDFRRYNLLVSDGRRILKMSYRLISKYQWHYRVLIGREVFGNHYYPHSMFVYRTKKIYVQQFDD